MSIVLVGLVGLVAVETIGLAILWSRYNSIKADVAEREAEELIAELDEQIAEEQAIEEETEDYDYFRYNYKAVLEADIEEIEDRMTKALEEKDYDTFSELIKEHNRYMEELELEEQLASVK